MGSYSSQQREQRARYNTFDHYKEGMISDRHYSGLGSKEYRRCEGVFNVCHNKFVTRLETGDSQDTHSPVEWSEMDCKIVDLTVSDVRFPTSLESDGSDAIHPDPDYSAVYVVLRTDTGHHGYGLAFTLGRGGW